MTAKEAIHALLVDGVALLLGRALMWKPKYGKRNNLYVAGLGVGRGNRRESLYDHTCRRARVVPALH